MTVLPDYFPIGDAASWLSTKLGRIVSTEYLHELERSGAIVMEVRVNTESIAEKGYWIHRGQMESLVPAVTAADVKMINGKIDAFMQRRRDVDHAADIASAENRARLLVLGSAEERALGAAQSPGDVDESRVVTVWEVTKPERWRSYNRPLYDLLKTACDEGKPCPAAADVLAKWADSPPVGYGVVVNPNRREMTYSGNGKQPTKSADSEAVSKAIKRMVKSQSDRR